MPVGLGSEHPRPRPRFRPAPPDDPVSLSPPPPDSPCPRAGTGQKVDPHIGQTSCALPAANRAPSTGAPSKRSLSPSSTHNEPCRQNPEMQFFRRDDGPRLPTREPLPMAPAPSLSPETNFQPFNWRRYVTTPKWITIHIITIITIVLTVLAAVYNKELIQSLRPWSEKVRVIPGGWLIPIVIMVVISFPPLFGHEIIGVLCGIVYGLWVGFGIVAAGTFFGEVGTWFAFRGLLRTRAERLERTNLTYAALARMTREGGFWIVLAIRFSVIPSHISTAVFSTCNVLFWHFAVSTFLTLPKQVVLVYIGTLLADEKERSSPTAHDAERTERAIKGVVIGVTGLLTLVLGVWIWNRMRGIKRVLLAEQDRRRSDLEIDSIKDAERTLAPLN
ncbi:hypothetical protein GGTG_08865 [Gaeumannomyces tritici R3-111a-1]|uniref:Golgi apparatus membrane protein TVP38 n=1 Tax=Gaeumannomyces tritici (strain R3-111a-1) TaxID=644352 RepID=J3P5S5_GAET3|nr:hypothetical protein GGTG_08865 [Gaeumannomyces tritici R3-111a-1]EJT75027.1 hypothetical protein GGTG_08865 [Gaeumannomyces tritici R3-111a-1]